jgi:hypothetical protein
MQTFKPAEADLTKLKGSARSLKEANEVMAEAKKRADAAKEFMADWLKRERGVELETLEVGEILSIDGVALIEIGKQTRFDEGAFSLAEPVLHARFRKEFSVKKFKPLWP